MLKNHKRRHQALKESMSDKSELKIIDEGSVCGDDVREIRKINNKREIKGAKTL